MAARTHGAGDLFEVTDQRGEEHHRHNAPPPEPEEEATAYNHLHQADEQLMQDCDTTGPGRKYEPWLGKAAKLDSIGKTIIAHYDHRFFSERKVHGGDIVDEPKIKYKTKYEPAAKERVMAAGAFNPSRLGDYLICSEHTPDEVKEEVARKMRSKKSQEVCAKLDTKRKAGDTMHEQVSHHGMKRMLVHDGKQFSAMSPLFL